MQYTSNKTHLFYSIIIIIIAVSAIYIVYKNKSPQSSFAQEYSLNQAMRKLWSDHVFWTRLYIISALTDAPDLKPTTDRLLKNQEDIGNAIATYYGKEAGTKLTALLKDHILIAADVVSAAQKEDKQKLEEANKKWHKNAEDIAEFLNK